MGVEHKPHMIWKNQEYYLYYGCRTQTAYNFWIAPGMLVQFLKELAPDHIGEFVCASSAEVVDWLTRLVQKKRNVWSDLGCYLQGRH